MMLQSLVSGRDASVGSLVWEDLNGNGVQDSGESGIDDVAVDLYDSGDNLIASTTTDTTGNYQITSITPGDYYLQFTAPSGSSFTTAFNGDDTLDSDAAPTDGDPTIALTPVFTLTAGESNPTLDAGLYQLGGVSGTAWRDTNANGTRDVGETFVGGASIDLLDANGNVLASTTTSGTDGSYSFANLVPGVHSVCIDSAYGLTTSKRSQCLRCLDRRGRR